MAAARENEAECLSSQGRELLPSVADHCANRGLRESELVYRRAVIAMFRAVALLELTKQVGAGSVSDGPGC